MTVNQNSLVRISGIYRCQNGHQITLVKGRVAPPCIKCGAGQYAVYTLVCATN